MPTKISHTLIFDETLDSKCVTVWEGRKAEKVFGAEPSLLLQTKRWEVSSNGRNLAVFFLMSNIRCSPWYKIVFVSYRNSSAVLILTLITYCEFFFDFRPSKLTTSELIITLRPGGSNWGHRRVWGVIVLRKRFYRLNLGHTPPSERNLTYTPLQKFKTTPDFVHIW